MYQIVLFDKTRIEDYLQAFEKASSGSVVCYCTHWNMTEEEIENKIIAPVKNNTMQLNQSARKVAERMINDGKICGYLAYKNGVPVGWCNCDDKSKYIFLARHVQSTTAEKKVKSIVCIKAFDDEDFNQVGSAILDTVCKEARTEGYVCIEAYPYKGAMVCADYGDVVKLYLSNGFQKIKKQGEGIVFQKML